jgi:hypothetical protein
VVAGVIGFLFAVIIFASVHWAAQPPSSVETIDASRLHLDGEFMEANLGTAIENGARPCATVFVRAGMHRGAGRNGRRISRDQPGRRPWISDRGHEREQHGRTRIRVRGADAVREPR